MKTIIRRNSFQTEDFRDAVFEVFESDVNATRLTEIKKLIGLMWHNTSIMPSTICDTLEVRLGSTYAMGARRMRELLMDEMQQVSSSEKQNEETF